MKTIELKLVQEKRSKTSLKTIKSWIDSVLENPSQYHTLKIGKCDIDAIKAQLMKDYDCEVREGVSDGCYGARTGKQFNGLTIYMDAKEFTDRYIDNQNDEIVNLEKQIELLGGELIEGIDGDLFRDACEDLDLKVSRNNTYNYEGQDGIYFLQHADYSIIQNSKDIHGTTYLSIKFHCGGDIRGNYSSTVVYKFDSIDDVYGCLYPAAVLKDVDQ